MAVDRIDILKKGNTDVDLAIAQADKASFATNKPEQIPDVIVFAKDTKEIFLNGEAYGGGGDTKLDANAGKSGVAIGGIDTEYDLSGKSVTKVIDDLLHPTYAPYVTQSGKGLTCSGNDNNVVREVGTKTPKEADYAYVGAGVAGTTITGKAGVYVATNGKGEGGVKSVSSTAGTTQYDTPTTKVGTFTVSGQITCDKGDNSKDDNYVRDNKGKETEKVTTTTNSRALLANADVDTSYIVPDTADEFMYEVTAANASSMLKINAEGNGRLYRMTTNITKSNKTYAKGYWRCVNIGTNQYELQRYTGKFVVRKTVSNVSHSIKYRYKLYAATNTNGVLTAQSLTENTNFYWKLKGGAQKLRFAIPESYNNVVVTEKHPTLSWGDSPNGVAFGHTVTTCVVCSTAGNAGAKVVTLVHDTFAVGKRLRVKFVNANSAQAPTLNGYPLKQNGSAFTSWDANAVLLCILAGSGQDLYWEVETVTADTYDSYTDANNVPVAYNLYERLDGSSTDKEVHVTFNAN